MDKITSSPISNFVLECHYHRLTYDSTADRIKIVWNTATTYHQETITSIAKRHGVVAVGITYKWVKLKANGEEDPKVGLGGYTTQSKLQDRIYSYIAKLNKCRKEPSTSFDRFIREAVMDPTSWAVKAVALIPTLTRLAEFERHAAGVFNRDPTTGRLKNMGAGSVSFEAIARDPVLNPPAAGGASTAPGDGYSPVRTVPSRSHPEQKEFTSPAKVYPVRYSPGSRKFRVPFSPATRSKLRQRSQYVVYGYRKGSQTIYTGQTGDLTRRVEAEAENIELRRAVSKGGVVVGVYATVPTGEDPRKVEARHQTVRKTLTRHGKGGLNTKLGGGGVSRLVRRSKVDATKARLRRTYNQICNPRSSADDRRQKARLKRARRKAPQKGPSPSPKPGV